MRLGLGLGLPPGGRTFNPAILFANGEQGAWYDPSDLTSMFQDTGGTTPAAVDAVVGLIRDKSGRGNHASQGTAAAKPILRQANGLNYLEFDGVDDFLATSAVDLSASDKMLLCVGVRKTGQATTGGLIESGAGVSVDDGSFLVCAPNVSATDSYAAFLRGNQVTGYNMTSYPGTYLGVLSCYFDIAGAALASEIFPRINGVTPGTLTPQAGGLAGPGNFGNLAFSIGARPNGVAKIQFFTGRLYGLISRSGASNAEQILAGERWMATRTGVTF